MADPSSPAAYEPRPLLRVGLQAWGIVALFGLVMHWLLEVVLGGLGPAPSLSTWMEFAAVMALLGLIAGAVAVLAEWSGSRWARCFALGYTVGAPAAIWIKDFVREPFGTLILVTLGTSVVGALVAGSMMYALGYSRR